MILTGASRGIGGAAAEIYLSQSTSHNLVAIARSSESLNALKEKYGDRVKTVTGDISDERVASEAIEKALEFGSIDSVVANAGVLDPVNTVAKADVAKWRNLFDINFFSVVDLFQKALPHVKESNGRFVAVSSGASTKSYYAWGAYGASKAALNHLVQTMVAEDPQVNAISVAPGVVDTNMQEDIRTKFGANMTPESLQRFIDFHKNKELLPPEVPANLLVNLAVKGWGKNLNGGYHRIGEEALKEFQ
ncbi:hypothetical protein ACI3LY_001026 [Candidozyma auris]|uniref:Uncharacterized protein n=3 Tax=Candidozyma auris TaxID=498019 RepID=A0A2H1A6S4_CANAR|nr:hypothetical_protein [[Candida] auris]PIS58581.1 hypothetical protein B9J08_000027 [[Candida] auris]PSK77002.1 hypothetical protein CJJ07_003188 [[Candida] auris]QEO20649.1 hypothetical_protein [[Candida] auris]QWW22927.1 hypothetical protein CA7LBN_001728 [[Candida] auris]GBL48832.1 putative SDR family mycofactocin-dependent oxidoreductase [[Candida] auris]